MKTNTTKFKAAFTLLFILFCGVNVNAQLLKKLGKRAEKAAERAVERRVEKETTEKTDQVLDSILEPGKKGKQPNTKEGSPIPRAEQPRDNSSGSSVNSGQGDTTNSNPEGQSLAVYNKYDFVPGDKLIVYDDFKNDFIGDFPSKWNSNGSGEIVTIGEANEKWMQLRSGRGTYYIPDLPNLPEDFTIEFDFLTTGLDQKTSSTSRFVLYLDDNNGFTTKKNVAIIEIPLCQFINTGMVIESWQNGQRTMRNSLDMDIRQTIRQESHVAIAVNKQRVRLWINEKKYVDIPRLLPDADIQALKLSPTNLRDGIDKVFVRNLKVAEGGVDLRRKLIAEGKISTNGILFDSGSANLQAQSMGIIRQIYQVLAQESNIKLKIVGHTDSDGNDDANLKLSKSRADAVKNVLVSIYNVPADRLITEGKGESEPVGDNTTVDGKAQNRRVEFIKQ